MKVVILGKDAMLANLIRGALLANAEIVGVFRYEQLMYSPLRLFLHDFFYPSTVTTLIKNHNLYDIQCKSANSEQFKKIILKLNPDVILVGTWRERIKKEIINLSPLGMINVHPSLLPKYRGPNPYIQTIWHREKKSGVTFHLMSEKFDEGAILAQAKVDILEGDTSKELKNKTVFLARILCAELLEKLKLGFVVPVAQDESKATYFGNVKPEDMTLDFLAETAEEIYAHVRAFYPFLPTYIQYGKDFYITNPYKTVITNESAAPGTIITAGKNSLLVAAKDGIVIRFDELEKYSRFKKFNI